MLLSHCEAQHRDMDFYCQCHIIIGLISIIFNENCMDKSLCF